MIHRCPSRWNFRSLLPASGGSHLEAGSEQLLLWKNNNAYKGSFYRRALRRLDQYTSDQAQRTSGTYQVGSSKPVGTSKTLTDAPLVRLVPTTVLHHRVLAASYHHSNSTVQHPQLPTSRDCVSLHPKHGPGTTDRWCSCPAVEGR
jgi:hypothetical protein